MFTSLEFPVISFCDYPDLTRVYFFTHCSLVTPYDNIWVNIGSGNGLLPDVTKPLSDPMLIYHQ